MAALENRGKDQNLGPAAVQTLVQMSQAWCRRAVQKAGNTAVLRYVTVGRHQRGEVGENKRNIVFHLRMLSEPASVDTVEALDTRVYLPAETNSTTTAWTAVCASFDEASSRHASPRGSAFSPRPAPTARTPTPARLEPLCRHFGLDVQTAKWLVRALRR